MVAAFVQSIQSMLDGETRTCSQRAIRSGRSWWALRYADKWVREWESEPASPNRHRDWPLLPKKGRQAVRLYCPNGKYVQLGDTHDASGRLFQFKVGVRNTSFGPLGTEQTNAALAQVVGMVHGLMGECTLFAWELVPPPPIPLDVPKAPIEQEWIAKSAEPGLYEAAVAQWNIDIKAYEKTPQYIEWATRFRLWERNAHGKLVGPIEDNVYKLNYHNLGQIKADHLGIDDGEDK